MENNKRYTTEAHLLIKQNMRTVNTKSDEFKVLIEVIWHVHVRHKLIQKTKSNRFLKFMVIKYRLQDIKKRLENITRHT